MLTFPVFLAVGYSPYQANVTNAVGVFCSNLGATWSYRHEVRRSWPEARRLCIVACAGSALGALTLLWTGAAVFAAIVPWLLAMSVVLVMVQPTLARAVRERAGGAPHRAWVLGAALVAAVYGGYFGAAMGVLLLGVLGLFLHGTMQRTNAFKNAMAVCVNGVDLVVFGLLAPVRWSGAAYLAAGTVVGGVLGAWLARRLPDRLFRLVVIAIGIAAVVSFLV